MEPTLLFIVEHAFQITDRGCVLVPGPSAESGGQALRVGDPVRLVTPDGQVVDTVVRGIELINRRPRPQLITLPILLPRNITKEQVPVGTRVFLLSGQSVVG